MSGWDFDDLDIRDRANRCCPLCLGIYVEEEKGGFLKYRSRTPHFFNHGDDCEARIIPTETMLQLYQDGAGVRAEVARLNSAG